MNDDDNYEFEEELTIEDPVEMLKGALAWVPRQNLYEGILETVDFMLRDVDEDEPINVLQVLNVLFCASVKGQCFHEPAPEQAQEPAPAEGITEEGIQEFMDLLNNMPEAPDVDNRPED